MAPGGVQIDPPHYTMHTTPYTLQIQYFSKSSINTKSKNFKPWNKSNTILHSMEKSLCKTGQTAKNKN